MILLVDNYDSFVYNLKRYLVRLGQQVVVVRNDQIDLDDAWVAKYQAIVISPGPQSPDQAGGCLELIRRFHDRLPMLGVCLGHQAICHAREDTRSWPRVGNPFQALFDVCGSRKPIYCSSVPFVGREPDYPAAGLKSYGLVGGPGDYGDRARKIAGVRIAVSSRVHFDGGRISTASKFLGRRWSRQWSWLFAGKRLAR